MFTLMAWIAELPSLPALSTLATVYIICLIVGGGLLVASAFLGGNGHVHTGADVDLAVDADVDLDVDAGVDVDADVDVDTAGGWDAAGAHDASAFSLTKWFSMRFVVFFTAAFGLIGTVLSFTSSMSSTAVLAWSVVGGLVMGQVAHQVFRAIRRSSGNTQVTRRDYLNKLARVSVAIKPSATGEVALTVCGVERFVPARARREDDQFAAGDPVVIVDYHNGTAQVISRKEFEFVTDSQSGDNDADDSDGSS